MQYDCNGGPSGLRSTREDLDGAFFQPWDFMQRLYNELILQIILYPDNNKKKWVKKMCEGIIYLSKNTIVCFPYGES